MKKGTNRLYRFAASGVSPSAAIRKTLSEASRVKDMTDKFIQYRKIETLNYYLLVEPEKFLVLLDFKNEKGN